MSRRQADARLQCPDVNIANQHEFPSPGDDNLLASDLEDITYIHKYYLILTLD